MFTGLVAGVGRLRDRTPRGADARLHFDAGTLALADAERGESIAVSGVCLTVVEFDARGFAADLSPETLARSTLGTLAPGAAVNFERAMLPTTRFGGHFVSGHVDGIGRVASIRHGGGSQRWRFELPAPLRRYVAPKGSLCVDGVSLTVNTVDELGCEVTLVPHTLAHTAFATTRVGAPVNLEVDLVARYVERLLESRDSGFGIREPAEHGPASRS